MNNVVTVTVNAPWVENYYDRTEVCDVPASLDKRLGPRWPRRITSNITGGGCAGFCPMRNWTSRLGFQLPRGGWRVLHEVLGVRQLSAVYSDAWVDDMLSMDPALFAEGENDTILTLDGDRGGNIAYCGHLFTEPELQPDGSLAFWQLSLTCESDDFKGWAGEETIVPDTATVTTVRLVPTENGWRVDALELPN